MASIISNQTPSLSGNGFLKTPTPISATLQRVEDNQGNQSAMSLSSVALSLNTFILTNFTPVYQTGGDLTIDASNNESVNCSVYGLTGANNIIFDNLFDGFSMSFVSLDTNVTTFSVSGGSGYTFANRQGHTQNAGQYAMTSVFFYNNTLFFGGDTA